MQSSHRDLIICISESAIAAASVVPIVLRPSGERAFITDAAPPLLIVPEQSGVACNVVIEAILTHVVLAPGWR
jgi:hypothetical protein